MDLRCSACRFLTISPIHFHSFPTIHRKTSKFTARSSLPFSPETAKYYRELQASVDVVQRACRLCVNEQKSMFSDGGRILEKIDKTPVTIADFGVQALVSLELNNLFPSIPLVAEEDSAFLRSNNLVDPVVEAVINTSSLGSSQLTDIEVLEAIDRGGKRALTFGAKPATYWVLDPIDGTRGFLRGGTALYVVGLALIVKGEIVLGVMGCPNWQEKFESKSTAIINVQEYETSCSESGIIMIAHVGCGTWTMRLSKSVLDGRTTLPSCWTRCIIDQCCIVDKAQFCIPDSQTWESLPFSPALGATSDANNIGDKQIRLLPTCCGSLCKYLMVASGRASVFVLQAKAQMIIKAWDHVVGMICVHEAGGKVTDWKGTQLDLAADEAERRIIFPSGGILIILDPD
ncbi:hypothetical protein Nepgr_007227 [Nepenthes gracilis]|uniref:PAP-specific phosphatase, mitochondrial n=1 Tax=Nepenthes gracilis TaxID=150966 RepID=A0AAD3S7B9_NEPGR|nr:hypothetical protein Nepgr_007227 [Nepenthes gracilis]